MGRIFTIVGAVVLSGVLLVLALPPADFGWIGWICLTPLYLAVRDKGFAFGFCAALATCMLAAFLTTVGWLYAPVIIPGLPTWHFVSFFLRVPRRPCGRARRRNEADSRLANMGGAGLGGVGRSSASGLPSRPPGPDPMPFRIHAHRCELYRHLGRFVSRLVCQPAAHSDAFETSALCLAGGSAHWRFPLSIPFRKAGAGKQPVSVGAVQMADALAENLTRASSSPTFTGRRLVVWPESGGSAGRSQRRRAALSERPVRKIPALRS